MESLSDIKRSSQSAFAGFYPIVPYSGRYRAPQITGIGNVTLVANQLYHIPIYLPAMTITEAAFYVSTAASGASVRLGLRRINASGAPSTLVAEFGTVSVASSGKKTITGLSVDIDEGWYFYDILSDGAPNTRGSTTNNAPLVLGFAFDASVHTCNYLYRAFTYGSLPSDETGETQVVAVGTDLMPIAGVK